ncbi:hypothetical protein ACFQZZ_29020 [Nocardia sp. GCM10030253]|uniref:hypothetical protein n=1 Tax=Nocardia sp. GCM10030253 TaxID=3273404 RepID=UPI003643E90F
MSKLRVFGVAFIAAAAVIGAGSGLASATVDQGITLQEIDTVAPGEPNPNGTGSAALLPALVKALTGSAGTTDPAA